MIPVTHPRGHALLRLEAREQSRGVRHLDFRSPVLALPGGDHLPALDVRDELHTVTDAEHRRDVEQLGVRGRNVILVHRRRPAAQNDAGRLPVANPIDAARRRVDLGVYPRLAHAPRDQLRELGAHVENEDLGAHERMFSARGRKELMRPRCAASPLYSAAAAPPVAPSARERDRPRVARPPRTAQRHRCAKRRAENALSSGRMPSAWLTVPIRNRE